MIRAIAATISLEEAALRPWDVVVAGAGPAGSLGRAGAGGRRCNRACWSINRLFRGKRYADRASTAPPWRRWAWRDWPIFRNGLGAMALRNMRLRAGRHEANLALPGGVSLSRRALDAALVHAAIESGAAFLPSTDATLEPTAGEFREVRLRSAGQGVKVKTRIAVAADGLSGSFLKETPGMEPIVAPGAPLGMGAVVDGSERLLRAGHDLYGMRP